MYSITADAAPPRERFDYWCDLFDRQVEPMQFERSREDPFRGEIHATMVGELPMFEFVCSGIQGTRTRSSIARSSDHCYAVCVNLDGKPIISRRGEGVALGRDDVFIVDTMHEFGLDLGRPCRQLMFKLPIAWMDGRLTRRSGLTGTVLPDHPLSRLLAAYLVNGFKLGDQLSPAASQMFAQHTVDLLAQALVETQSGGSTPPDAWRAAMFVRALRLIALKFADPNLTPARIATALGMSTRLLQRIFAQHGETVMKRLWEERLRRAANMLASPAARHRSITEIAYSCGFSDSAHFTRAFAARMGAPPSRWRRRVT